MMKEENFLAHSIDSRMWYNVSLFLNNIPALFMIVPPCLSSKSVFLPIKEDDKKYKALSLSNHLLLLCVHLTFIVDWLPSTLLQELSAGWPAEVTL